MIHNGLDVSYLTGHSKSRAIMRVELDIDDNVLLIFAAGTLDHHKGLDVLLHALPQFLSILAEADDNRLAAHQPPVVLIAGDGILRKSLEELAAALGLSEMVRFIGYRDDMPALMSAADLFVLSSRWEGCPMVVLEAMALGVPIVATGVGGVPELVLHNETGLVVAPENPNEMAAAMFDLLSNREKAYCLARAGQDRLVKHFSVQTSADCLAKMYEQIVGEMSQ
jgi:glycosyltransferase involved in cell wall biosynthesis